MAGCALQLMIATRAPARERMLPWLDRGVCLHPVRQPQIMLVPNLHRMGKRQSRRQSMADGFAVFGLGAAISRGAPKPEATFKRDFLPEIFGLSESRPSTVYPNAVDPQPPPTSAKLCEAFEELPRSGSTSVNTFQSGS
jgi:hypothetical protein